MSFIPTGAVRPTVPFFQVMGPHQWWLGASYCRYDASVRTTIDLPDDIHELVRYLAASRGESLGATIAAVLEPLIHKLLERNLTAQIEALVRREVEKALKDVAPR